MTLNVCTRLSYALHYSYDTICKRLLPPHDGKRRFCYLKIILPRIGDKDLQTNTMPHNRQHNKRVINMIIKTGSWSAKAPEGHIKIGISRGSPRGHAAGYRLYKTLAPGAWFNSVTPDVYLERYGEILEALDPETVVSQIEALAGDKTPVLCCFEAAAKINEGSTWCHRSIAAAWLEARLGIKVEELDAPKGFNPWAFFEAAGITPPKF